MKSWWWQEGRAGATCSGPLLYWWLLGARLPGCALHLRGSSRADIFWRVGFVLGCTVWAPESSTSQHGRQFDVAVPRWASWAVLFTVLKGGALTTSGRAAPFEVGAGFWRSWLHVVWVAPLMWRFSKTGLQTQRSKTTPRSPPPGGTRWRAHWNIQGRISYLSISWSVFFFFFFHEVSTYFSNGFLNSLCP
jgi:hypothetical protein